jgi:hypothetical protein
MRFRHLLGLFVLCSFVPAAAQTIQPDSLPAPTLQLLDSDSLRRVENFVADTTYIGETEDEPGLPAKVLHAEPLFIDLIRDLGARKGESEWNYGIAMTDVTNYVRYEGLIEYEWAPLNRLGLEVEIPVSFYRSYRPENGGSRPPAPADRIEGLKLAAQYSFFVSERLKTSLALGYLHTFKFYDLNRIGRDGYVKGNQYNPFFVAAKRWGNNFHSLIYTGPILEKPFGRPLEVEYALNTSVHYMITGTRNFIGLEVNKEFYAGNSDVTFRPQMRLGITENVLIGIVTSIPISVERERFGTFLRLIYEPKHRKG